MKQKTVALIGMGLIGGSIAKALHVHKGNYRVLATDTNLAVLETAKRSGWIDEWRADPLAVAAEADLAVLCVPACEMFHLAEKIGPVLKKGSVLTDVGSIKGVLLEKLPPCLPKGVYYVGGHPMAGSEKSGLDASDAGLFVGRPYVVVPAPGATEAAVQSVTDLAKALRAVPVFMDAGKHDLAAAMVSHMPHVLSTALMLTAVADPATVEAKFLAAGCFRDMTRVSGADARMWTDICLTNPEAILAQIGKVEELLALAKGKIALKDGGWLMDFFGRGRAGREEFGMFVTDGRGE